MTGERTAGQGRRDLAVLGRRGIEVRQAVVDAIDPETRRVALADGETIAADAIVVALGAELAPERVPGLERTGGLFYYTLSGAERLRDQPAVVGRGRVAVVVADVPFKCPAAPYEAAMPIDHALRRRRVRDRVDVAVYAAEPGPMGVAGPEVSRGVVALLDPRGIDYHPGVKLAAVGDSGHEIRFAGGAKAHCDVLAVVAPTPGAAGGA